LVGADSSMFATTLLACDMGGYPLAMQLAANKAIGNFSGLILGTMMGPTIVFTIPVALSIIKKEDRPYLGAGILAGMITIPIGCIAGGLAMNMTQYKISIGTILVNLIPVIIIAALIVAGLWFAPQKMINGFNKFGTGVTVLITIFTAIAVFEYQTGIKFPLMNIMVEKNADGVVPLESGLLVCGQIAIVLIGAFPMVKWITNTFGGALKKIGSAFGMDENGSAGLVANLANNIAMFNIMGDMNPKGKLLNVAFAVSAAFVFGDHLGFTAGVNSEMIFPVVLGKLVAGITALILANALAPMLLSKVQSAKTEEK
jgi:Ethanolamine utilization protein